jgi:hypothetical protein
MGVSEDDGQTVRAAFLLRENLYLVKDRSMYVTADDGVNEPASWTINRSIGTVGTPSVAACRYGRGLGGDRRPRRDVHFRRRRADQNIAGNSAAVGLDQLGRWATLWVRVDTLNKRILCGVPIGTATSPNLILVLDYRSLSDANEIESLGSVLFSTLSGKLYAVGRCAQVVPVEYHGELLHASRAPRRHGADISGKRRGQRENLSALRHAILRRRRG